MNTWGISGSDFLLLYVGLFVISWVAVLAVRQRIAATASRAAAPGQPHLDVYELAMLNGGGRLVLAVAACRLKEAGGIQVEGRGLGTMGPPPANADPVEKWLYTHVDENAVNGSGLLAAGPAEPILGPIRDGLEKRGLLLTARQIMSMRWAVLWFLPLLALGVARIVAGTANHHPVTYLVFLMLLTVFFALNLGRLPRRVVSTNPAVRLFCVPRVTTAGARVLSRSQQGHVYRVAGSTALATEVALSGVGALLVADAAFAATLGISSAGSSYGFAGTGAGGGCGGGGGGCGGGGGGGGGGCGG